MLHVATQSMHTWEINWFHHFSDKSMKITWLTLASSSFETDDDDEEEDEDSDDIVQGVFK